MAHAPPAMAKSRSKTKSNLARLTQPPPPLTHGPAEIAGAEANVRALLRFLGDDPEREGLLETPARYVRALSEHFAGYGQDPGDYLAKTFEDVEGYDELVLVSDIEVYSHC